MSIITPILGIVSTLLARNKQSIADDTGIDASIVSTIMDRAGEYLQKDERIADRLYKELASARDHDIKTFDSSDKSSNRLRSSVRPICTFVCLGWYIFARMNEIPLKPEDYAIVGGVLAFWFGFRPFEKQQK